MKKFILSKLIAFVKFLKDYINYIFGYENIEASYNIFFRLFSAFCDIVKTIFGLAAILIIGSLFYDDDRSQSYFAIGIWLATFLAFYAAIGLMSTLVVIAERLKPKPSTKEQFDDLLKIIITGNSKTTYSILITPFGEGKHKYCEGYAILSIRGGMKEVIVKKIPISFEEVLMYEYALDKDKRVGRAIINLEDPKGDHIHIKVPTNSIIFDIEANLDPTKWSLVASGEIRGHSDGNIIYDIQDFMMMKWDIDLQEFYDSLKSLSNNQNYDEAKNIIDELASLRSNV